MSENKPFEHEIDPDLLAEIEEWDTADHDEPAEYYFSNPDPYLKPAAQSTPSQAAMTAWKRWIERWSASWAKSLQKRWRILNDKYAVSWYNRSNQSCTGSCPFEGGNRNVTGN